MLTKCFDRERVASNSICGPLLIKRLSCRLHFTQYKNTWLVRIRLCRLVAIRLLSWRFSSDFLVSTKCKAIFAVASFRNSSAQIF